MAKASIFFRTALSKLASGLVEKELIGLMNEITKVNREKQTLKFYTILLLLTVNYTLEKEKTLIN